MIRPPTTTGIVNSHFAGRQDIDSEGNALIEFGDYVHVSVFDFFFDKHPREEDRLTQEDNLDMCQSLIIMMAIMRLG